MTVPRPIKITHPPFSPFSEKLSLSLSQKKKKNIPKPEKLSRISISSGFCSISGGGSGEHVAEAEEIPLNPTLFPALDGFQFESFDQSRIWCNFDGSDAIDAVVVFVGVPIIEELQQQQ